MFLSKSPSSFTLIELIVVIIIVGILASVGISQYSKTVEKMRGAEARTISGKMRKLAYEYYLQNGTVTGIQLSDLNIGTSADQIPSACRSSHYFYYSTGWNGGSGIDLRAYRCTSGGKTPQYSSNQGLILGARFEGATESWWCDSAPDVGCDRCCPWL